MLLILHKEIKKHVIKRLQNTHRRIITANVTGIDCGTPPTVLNSLVSMTSTLYGDNIVYSCLHGYWVSNQLYSTETTCLATGDWSPVPTTCQSKFSGYNRIDNWTEDKRI